jgi:hypothetical protein
MINLDEEEFFFDITLKSMSASGASKKTKG